MTDLPLPHGFELDDGAYCVVSGVPGNREFAYIPGPPRIERCPGNRPHASLMDSRDAEVLTLQCVWELEDGGEKLRAEIARRYPEEQNAFPEIVCFDRVSARLNIGADVGAVIGPKGGSDRRPYCAVLDASIADAARQEALSGFGGIGAEVVVTYNGAFRLTSTVDASIEGDIARAFKALAPAKPEDSGKHGDSGWFGWRYKKKQPKLPTLPAKSVDLTACETQVEALLKSCDLTLKVLADPNATAALIHQVTSELKAMAAKDILQSIERMGTDAASISHYDVTHRQQCSETHCYTVSRAADLGAWFAAHDGEAPTSTPSMPIPKPT